MRLRNTYLTGAASYLRMGSQVLCGLVAIPLALHFLSTEQFGLWAFVAQSLGYLLLLDLGVGHSLGRLLAEPLHAGNEQEWNGWFNLALIVVTIQAAVVLGVGLLLVNPILHWFAIPAPLFTEARELWLIMLVLNAVMFPLRLFRGIVGAQNRSYWISGGAALGAWGGLLAFYVFLKAGWGVLAYGWLAGTQLCLTMGLPLAATLFGPHRFRLSWRNIPWRHLRELFGFSLALFTISMAGQVVFMSQSLVITKILGLAAVASFTVCSRVPMLLMQAIWQPFDSFIPRWQIYWAKGQKPALTREFRRMFRFTVGFAVVAMVCCFSLNRWFVFIFGKQSLYAGKTFDFFFAIFVMAQVWAHCLAYNFILSKRMKGLTVVTGVGVPLFLIAAIVGTKLYGLTGYIVFTTVWDLIGVELWYKNLRAPKELGLRLASLLREQAPSLLAFCTLMGAGWLAFHEIRSATHLLIAETMLNLVALAWFIVYFRQDLLALLRRLQQVWQNRAAARPEAPPAG